MSDASSRSIDPEGEARSVLSGAVIDFGLPVLSNTSIIEGVCEDRLPDWPREANLIANAAAADVPGLLRQQSAAGPDTAVRLTASTLADSKGLDPVGSIWVVTEFARALGMEVTEGLEPAAATSSVVTPEAAPDVGVVEEATILPEDDNGVGVAGGGSSGPNPKQRRMMQIIAAVAAVFIAYILVAASTSIFPFAAAKKPSPTTTTTTTTTTVPTTTPPTSSTTDKTLSGIIPAAVSTNYKCAAVTKTIPSGEQEISCTVPTSKTAAKTRPIKIIYARFSSAATISQGLTTFLNQHKIAKTSGTCTLTTTTGYSAPCEKGWQIKGASGDAGQFLEIATNSVSEIGFTSTSARLLVVAGSTTGNALVKWWRTISNWCFGSSCP